MPYICVICTLNRPPLLPLAIEHRRILEAIVSPVVSIGDLRPCHLLLCVECQVKMLSIHQFQKTALQGIRNLKYLLSKLPFETLRIDTEDEISEVITVKIEPVVCEEIDIAQPTENVKPEPAALPDPAALAVGTEPAGRAPATDQPDTSNSVTIATQTAVGPAPAARKPAAPSRPRPGLARTRAGGVRKRCRVRAPRPPPGPTRGLRARLARKPADTPPSECHAEALRHLRHAHKEETAAAPEPARSPPAARRARPAPRPPGYVPRRCRRTVAGVSPPTRRGAASRRGVCYCWSDLRRRGLLITVQEKKHASEERCERGSAYTCTRCG